MKSSDGLWRRLGRWLVVAVIFGFIGRSVFSNWEELSQADLTFEPIPLAISVMLLALWMIGHAMLWHLLTRSTHSEIPLRKATASWFYSQLGKYVPGKVFLYMGRIHLYLKEGRRPAPVTVAFGLEMILTLGAALLTALLAMLSVQADTLDAYRWWALSGLVAFVVVLHPRILDAIVALVARLSRRQPFSITVSYPVLLGYLGLYVLNWMVFGLAFYLMIDSFYGVSGISIFFLAGAFSLASSIGIMALFAPSGLGVREGILGVFLDQVMPLPVALITAIICRVWITVAEVALAGVGYLLIRSDRRSDTELPSAGGVVAFGEGGENGA